jgi:hypothetical protein
VTFGIESSGGWIERLTVVTPRSCARSTPFTTRPSESPSWNTIALAYVNAEAPTTCGSRASFAASASPSSMPSVVAPSSTTCASVPAMRDCTSPSKPFITASTTSSAVTPTATPATLMPVRSRTNPVRGRALR